MPNRWEAKDPCWRIMDCSKYVYPKCSAYLSSERPCWENAYTQNEILLGVRRDCESCRVFKLYHRSSPSLSRFRGEGVCEGKPD